MQPPPPIPKLVTAGPEGIPVITPVDQRRPAPSACITRTRSYSFLLDDAGLPQEIGSGRFAKTYLGEEVWSESKTNYRRRVAIKILQKNASVEDQLRFQLEKQILEHVQGHPNVVEILASGESDNPLFIPRVLRDRVENDFIMLDLLDTSLEE